MNKECSIRRKTTFSMNVASFLTRLIWGIFALIIVVCFYHSLSVKYGGYEKSKYVIIAAAFLIIALASTLLSRLEKKGTCCKYASLIILFLFALFVRLLILHLSGFEQSVQVSDFNESYLRSQMPWGEMGEWPIVFSNWGMPSVFYKTFGLIGLRSIPSLLIFNATLMSASCLLIYQIVYTWSETPFEGYLSALVFAIWPQFVMYGIILSPEMPSIFFMLLSLLLLQCSGKTKSNRNRFLLGFAGGSIMAFSGSLKSLDWVVIIALVIISILSWLCKHENRKIVTLAICIFSWGLGSLGTVEIIERSVSHDVNPSPAAYYLRTGLGRECEGLWDANIALTYVTRMRESDYDFEYVNKITLQEALEENRIHHHLNTSFFNKKWHDAYASDVISFSLSSMGADSAIVTGDWFMKTLSLTHLWYQCCIFSMLLGGVVGFFHKELGTYLLSALIWMGFLLMIVFPSESQTRYKVSTYPYASILIGHTFGYLTCLIKARLFRFKERLNNREWFL